LLPQQGRLDAKLRTIAGSHPRDRIFMHVIPAI
jgi:hypothetical protein